MFIAVSYKNLDGFDNYYRMFESAESAQDFLDREESDFRTREVYDFDDPARKDDFFSEWTKDFEDEETAAGEGYSWDDYLGAFTRLASKDLGEA